MIKKKLKYIFSIYKKQYKLKTKLIFTKHISSGVYFDKKELIFNIDHLNSKNNIEDMKKRVGNYKNKNILIIGALLHEICHILEKEKIREEFKNINLFLYYTSSKYHHTIPFEIRADEFARKEIQKLRKQKLVSVY